MHASGRKEYQGKAGGTVVNQTEKMGTEKIPALLRQLAVPAVVAQVINLLYNIVDRIYIGHMKGTGATALTGVGLFVPILMLITAFAMLVSSGGAPLMSMKLGKGDKAQAEAIIGNCFAALLMIAVALTALLFFSVPYLLRFFGASDVTYPYALVYARIYILGTVAVLTANGMNLFITAQGFARTAMLSTAFGAITNIVLDPIFIFAFHMGVAGAAIATVISQVISSIWILYFLSGKATVRLKKELIRIKPGVLNPCLALGVSTFVMVGTEGVLSMVFSRSLAAYGGDLAVGTMAIISSLSSLVTMPLQGMTQGGQPIISYNYGAGKKDRIRKAFYLLLVIDCSYAFLFYLMVMLFPGILAGIFTDSQELLTYAVRPMRVYFAGIFSVGFQMTCQSGFVALGQAKKALAMACLRKLVLLIPLILILPHVLPDPVFGVFVAEPFSDIISAVVTTALFLTTFHKDILA